MGGGSESDGEPRHHLSRRAVVHAWLPLAASWLLMSVELPAVSAVIARLADPEIHLAAYGGVVFPIALVIEAPIIMLLAASTALCKDRASYRALSRFMHTSGGLLTVLHVVLAFTPLSTVLVRDVMGEPPEVLEPARLGLMLLTPWTWSIAYRRFQQGVLIRFGHSRAVGWGTVIRLVANGVVLVVGYGLRWPGVVVAATAVSCGVLAEAVYAGLRVRPVVRRHLSTDHPHDTPLRGRAFYDFYVPLAMTNLVTLIIQPIGSAALGRMPQTIESLAVWPVVHSIVFFLQALGLAYNEVVVATLDRPGAKRTLWWFTVQLAVWTTVAMVGLAVTPLSTYLFGGVLGLAPPLAKMGVGALWIVLPIPAMRALQSWYQGVLVHCKETGAITEAVIVFMVVCIAILWAGVVHGGIPGLEVAMAAFAVARTAQTLHLWIRSRGALARLP